MGNSYIDEYRFMDFPWLSKTTYKLFMQCRYKFHRYVIEHQVRDTNIAMELGTAVHLVFFKFFDEIDWNYLTKLEWWQSVHTIRSPVFRYFLSICYNIAGDKITNKNMIYNFNNFCMFEEEHFVSIIEKEKNLNKAMRMFIPTVHEREFTMTNDEYRLFGTVDRIIEENGRTIIVDYKTGNVPASVLRDDKEGPYSGAVLGHYAVEGGFYLLQYLLKLGYRFEKRKRKKDGEPVIEMIDHEGNIVTDIISKKFDFAFLFTGVNGKEPMTYIARKKGNIRTIRSILKNIEIIRSCADWYRNPNIMKCRYCVLFFSECKEKVPFEIFRKLRGSEDSA